MNTALVPTLIVPGYNDTHDYIDEATKNWPARYGLEAYVQPFGTKEPDEDYDANWNIFEKTLRQFGPAAIIGISFGASIALRALQDHPELVSSVICIAGPHDLRQMDQTVIDDKYPLLNKALPAIKVDKLPTGRIMTLRPIYDQVISPRKVTIEGATNRRMLTPVPGHAAGIWWALHFHAKDMAKFIKSHQMG